MSMAGRCMAASTASGMVVGPGMERNSRPLATVMLVGSPSKRMSVDPEHRVNGRPASSGANSSWSCALSVRPHTERNARSGVALGEEELADHERAYRVRVSAGRAEDAAPQDRDISRTGLVGRADP